MAAITVLIVEDHAVVREAIRCLLEIKGKVMVAGEAENGVKAVQLARELHPDVVLMDIAMPDLNGIEATRRILKEDPGVRVLILSAHEEDAYVDQAVAAGASGYLVKQDSITAVVGAIRDVCRGKPVFSPSIAKRLDQRNKNSIGHSGAWSKRTTELSQREAETLQAIAEGKANKRIAGDLGISIKTVEKHRHNLMAKLDIHDIAGLTRYALSAGVIEGGYSGSASPRTGMGSVSLG